MTSELDRVNGSFFRDATEAMSWENYANVKQPAYDTAWHFSKTMPPVFSILEKICPADLATLSYAVMSDYWH